jgi:hypothetical protein
MGALLLEVEAHQESSAEAGSLACTFDRIANVSESAIVLKATSCGLFRGTFDQI